MALNRSRVRCVSASASSRLRTTSERAEVALRSAPMAAAYAASSTRINVCARSALITTMACNSWASSARSAAVPPSSSATACSRSRRQMPRPMPAKLTSSTIPKTNARRGVMRMRMKIDFMNPPIPVGASPGVVGLLARSTPRGIGTATAKLMATGHDSSTSPACMRRFGGRHRRGTRAPAVVNAQSRPPDGTRRASSPPPAPAGARTPHARPAAALRPRPPVPRAAPRSRGWACCP